MTNMRRRYIVVLCILCFSLFTSSCKEKVDPFLEAFDLAVTEDRLQKAEDIYQQASLDSDFDRTPYVERLHEEISLVLQKYKDAELNYDEATLQLQKLASVKGFKEDLKEDVKKAQSNLLPDDFIEESLKHAQIYVDAGSYEDAILLLSNVLNKYPEQIDVKSKRDALVGEFISKTDEEAKALVYEGYPRLALTKIERALEYVPDNQTLKATQEEIQNRIKSMDLAVQDAVPLYDLEKLYAAGDLEGAQAYIDKLKKLGKNVEVFQKEFDGQKDSYIRSMIVEAQVSAQMKEGRWETNPYQKPIDKMNELLRSYPGNEELLTAKKEFESLSPINVASTIDRIEGIIHKSARGTAHDGYEYKAGMFNEAIKFKPDAHFSFEANGHKKVKIFIVPESADTKVYSNMVLEIVVDDEVIYSEMPFAFASEPVDMIISTTEESTIEVRVRQSGFASFFDKILGRNNMYAEIFLVK